MASAFESNHQLITITDDLKNKKNEIHPLTTDEMSIAEILDTRYFPDEVTDED
jgi:hypothetical protein